MKRFKSILCIADSSEKSMPAIEKAVALAENNQASLKVVDVIDSNMIGGLMVEQKYVGNEIREQLVSSHLQELDAFLENFRQGVDIESAVIIGTPFLEIIYEVLRNSHDLVIRVAEDPDWLDKLFGSDDMHLIRKCPCPVWLVKPGKTKTYRRILAAVDVTETGEQAEIETRWQLNRQILEMAASIAITDFAELHILHVWDAVGESAMRGAFMHKTEEEIQTYVEEVRTRHATALERLFDEVATSMPDSFDYLKPKKHLLKGWARKAIPKAVSDIQADLVVMGTVVRTGIPGFIIGNTAEEVLNQLTCSVLAVKPPGFTSPVTLEGQQ
jgi:nucleotide-binding universal stress UspA family protein